MTQQMSEEAAIRLAEFSDMEQLLELGVEFHKHAELDKFGLGFNRKGFAGVLVHFMSNPNCCLMVAEIDDKVVGTIAGMVAPWFLDPAQLNASEHLWFVLPLYRGSVSLELLVNLETWAKAKGAKCLATAGLTGKRLPVVTRLYRQKGFNPVEMHFIKEI